LVTQSWLPAGWLDEFLTHGSVGTIQLGDSQARVDRVLGRRPAWLFPDFSSINMTHYFDGALELYAEHEIVALIAVYFRNSTDALLGSHSALDDVIRVLHEYGHTAEPQETFSGYFDATTYLINNLHVKLMRGRLHTIKLGCPEHSMPVIRKPGPKRPRIVWPKRADPGWALVVEAPNKVRVVIKQPNDHLSRRITPLHEDMIETRKGRLAFRKAESQVLSWMQDPTFMAELVEADSRVIRPPRKQWWPKPST
jgi:hypothetical protein